MDVVWKVAELAIRCVEPRGKHRPSMQDVLRELREAIYLNSSSGTYDASVRNSANQFRPSNGSGEGPSSHSNYSSADSMVQPRAR